MRKLFAFLALLLPRPAEAEIFSIKEVSYAEIQESVSEVVDFEDRQHASTAGLLIYPGVAFGERFTGQTLIEKQDDFLDWHDVLSDETPDAPLSVFAGAARQNLVVQRDAHWGSMALHPIGPYLGPWPDRNVGTGALAMRFDPPICSLAFRTAIDGMSRFGHVNETILRGKPEGSLTIRFYDEDGQELASFMRNRNSEGPIAIGYMQSGQVEPRVAGVFLQGLDFEGFAIDDVRFNPDCPLKLY